MLDDHGKIDTLAQYGYEVKFLDIKILNNDNVCYIIEAPLHIEYVKFIKDSTGKWQRSKTSGILGANPNDIPSAPIRGRKRIKNMSYKIIGDDLVRIKLDDDVFTIDCHRFKVEQEAKEKKVREWLKNEERKKQEEENKNKSKIDKKSLKK